MILGKYGVEEAKKYPGIEFMEKELDMENQLAISSTTRETVETTESHDVWL